MAHRLAAEFVGTFLLASAVAARRVFAADPAEDKSVGIGFLGVSVAFGLTVLAGVYAFGVISGGHFNPAVTLGAALAKRVEWKALPAYRVVHGQVGGLVAGLVIWVIAKGKSGYTATGHMAANGYGAHSPFGYSSARC
jgi:aquaporin Z